MKISADTNTRYCSLDKLKPWRLAYILLQAQYKLSVTFSVRDNCHGIGTDTDTDTSIGTPLVNIYS